MARVEMKRVQIEETGGVSKLREKVLFPPEICIERGYLMAELYRETKSEQLSSEGRRLCERC